MDYDAFAHHITFRSVFAGVVSLYGAHGPTAVLAEKWRQSDNFRTWEFQIRSGLTFENGDPITAEAVRSNWNRVAFLMHSQDSKSGLFEYLVGIENLKSPEAKFDGIQVMGNSVFLRFVRPIPDLIEKIS